MTQHIHTPSVVNVKEEDNSTATFTIEPLHTGYGMTLGNSLRRVLLSSIAGAAVTSFKVEGASHEFTTLPGVKEDVVDIMLNLKGIRFKLFGDDKQTLRLEKKGKGKVTAKNIQTSGEVEVANPEHVIATIDDDKASVVMDLVVEKGRGYRTNEEMDDSKTANMITIDAIFSPVRRVRYKVDNTRVGQVTDLNKLIMTVETDGTITPLEAFEESAAILVNQYTVLAGQTRIETNEPTDYSEESERKEDVEDASQLNTPIEDLNLSARTTNALINNEIHTLKDLFSLNDTELRDLKGFGNKALDEVKDKLTELEL